MLSFADHPDLVELELCYAWLAPSELARTLGFGAELLLEAAGLKPHLNDGSLGGSSKLGVVLTSHGTASVLSQARDLCAHDEARDVLLAHCLATALRRGIRFRERRLTEQGLADIETWDGRALLGVALAPDAVEAARQHAAERGFDVEMAGATTRIRRERDDGRYNRIVGAVLLPLAPLGGKAGIARASAMIRGKSLVDQLTISPAGLSVDTTVGDAPVSSRLVPAAEIVGVTGAARPRVSGAPDAPALRAILTSGIDEVMDVEDAPTACALRTLVVDAVHRARA